MRETFYYQTYAKLFEPSVYHTEFRNSMMEALATTGERLDNVGCTESHNYHKCLIEYWKLSTLIVSGSIAKGLFYMYNCDLFHARLTATTGHGVTKKRRIRKNIKA